MPPAGILVVAAAAAISYVYVGKPIAHGVKKVGHGIKKVFVHSKPCKAADNCAPLPGDSRIAGEMN